LVKADANRQRGVPGGEANWSDRPSISRPVREYLAALDQAQVEKNTPKNISLTDPAAQMECRLGTGVLRLFGELSGRHRSRNCGRR
jgi:hypothetical protein